MSKNVEANSPDPNYRYRSIDCQVHGGNVMGRIPAASTKRGGTFAGPPECVLCATGEKPAEPASEETSSEAAAQKPPTNGKSHLSLVPAQALSPVILKAAGYTVYRCDDAYCGNTLWRKCIIADNVKRYFINVRFYKFRFDDGTAHESTEAEALLYLDENDPLYASTGFVLKLRDINTAISDVETFFEHAYKALNCVPDIHNQ